MTLQEINAEMVEISKRTKVLSEEWKALEKRFHALREEKKRILEEAGKVQVVTPGKSGPKGLTKAQKDALQGLGLL